MDADLILRRQVGFSEGDSFENMSDEEIADLVTKFAIWPSVDSYRQAPWLARYAIRRQRHRVDIRAPGEKRDLWGMPNESGYFADDNSLLKSTFKNLVISGSNNPYGGSNISSGLVCCHIWPGTTGDPLLFSFLPNLVWIPKSLARFTDVFMDKPAHKVHFLLQGYSYSRYREVPVLTGGTQIEDAWALLNRPSLTLEVERSYTEMKSEPSLSKRVSTRHLRLITFLDAAIEENMISQRRFSKRYHLGVGSGIDKTIPPITKLVSKNELKELRRIIEETSPAHLN